MKGSFRNRTWAPAVGWGIVLLGIGAMVAPLFSANRTLAFRDAGHYYYRLYQWQAECVQSGEGLRWNPQENLGQAMHGDATASLFYPPKAWLWSGPFSFPMRWNAYLIGHLLWAAVGAGWLGRCLGLRGAGRCLVALCYAGSGVVLIQLCNVIFLVGAAWLPWALGCGLRAIAGYRITWALLSGVCLAMMVLGGDPQTAYHVMLVLAARLCWARFSHHHDSASASPASWGSAAPRGWRPEDVAWRIAAALHARRWAIGLLLVMALVGLCLSWIQVSGSLSVARASERNLWQHPRSLVELPSFLKRADGLTPQQKFQGTVSGLLGNPPTGTHHDFAFQFSLPPWQIAEWIWPNADGRMFPQQQRWTQRIPAADRVWLPSLYAGLIPFGLALSTLLRRQDDPNLRWLKGIGLFFLLASMGWYGLGWIGKEAWVGLAGREPVDYPVGSPVGGVYWWMTVVLPGYIQFRYPAKLMLVVTLALACLAGRGWQSISTTSMAQPRRVFGGLAILSVSALIVVWVARAPWSAWLAGSGPDAVFGPFQLESAWHDLQRGLVQGLLLSVLVWGLMRWAAGRRWFEQPWFATGLLVLTALDLAVAHQGLLLTSPISQWQAPSTVASVILDNDRSAGDTGDDTQPRRSVPAVVYRAAMDGWTPSEWWRTADPARLQQVIAWDQQTLFPKHHLRYPITLVESPGSMANGQYWVLLQRARQAGIQRPDGMQEISLNWLSALGTEYLIVPSWSAPQWSQYASTLQIKPAVEGWPAETLLLENTDASPQAWVVADTRFEPFEFGSDLLLAWQQSERILWQAWPDVPRDFNQQVVLHKPLEAKPFETRTDRPDESLETAANAMGGKAGDSAGRPVIGWSRILEQSNERLDLQAHLQRAGWLIVPQAYADGWQATVEDLATSRRFTVPVERVNGVMRGVPLQPGDYLVQMRFEPPGWRIHWSVTGLGWLALLAWFGTGAVRSRWPVLRR